MVVHEPRDDSEWIKLFVGFGSLCCTEKII